MFWARWMLGNLCFQQAWLELWALMNKHLQACLEKPQCWPQTPHWCWHFCVWDQSQPWCEQGLCNSLEGRDSFILSKKEPARDGGRAQSTTAKLSQAQEQICSPLEIQLGIKHSLGSLTCLPDVVFLRFRALIVSQLGFFMAGSVPAAKQLKILWLWGEGRDGELPGERWPWGNGRSCYPFLSIHTCKTDVVNTLPTPPARFPAPFKSAAIANLDLLLGGRIIVLLWWEWGENSQGASRAWCLCSFYVHPGIQLVCLPGFCREQIKWGFRKGLSRD